MNKSVITLKEERSIGEVTMMFSRYGFRSLPVTNKDNKIVGVAGNETSRS
jgi:predicted transcriptional regulator